MKEPMEFSGKSTEDALEKASRHFNLPLNRLEVEVLSTGSAGLLGLFGGKKATVMVRPMASTVESDVAEVMAELTGNGGPKPGGAQKGGAKRPGRQRQKPPRQKARGNGGTAPGAGRNAEPDQFGSAPDAGDIAGDAPRAERTPRPPEGPEVVASAKEVLERFLEALDPEATVSAESSPQGVMLDVEGQEAGILIGRRGQTLEALQYLVTRIVSHQQGRPVRISVDAGGYRRRRRESLEELALRMAEKARDTGRSQAVGPFSAQERRLVHLALRGHRGISTISRGRGEFKKVVIAPKG